MTRLALQIGVISDTKRSISILQREPLIAISLAKRSVVKVEVEGRRGETTLTTHSEPYNATAIHAEKYNNLNND